MEAGNSTCDASRRSRSDSTTGLCGERREKVSNWRVRVAPRCAASSIASAARATLGSSVIFFLIVWMCPLTTIRRLLKSWATPPVSCPSASIFCAWARCCCASLKLDLRVTTLGDVACDLGETDQRAVLVSYGIDHDVGPEHRAVLADAPSLRFNSPFLCRSIQRMRRQSRLPGRVPRRTSRSADR